MTTTDQSSFNTARDVQAPRPYLCGTRDAVPNGWQRSQAAPGTSTCVAFDPTRHTVVRNLDNKNHAHLAAIGEQAGFASIRVPGSDSGFLVRDRRTPSLSTMKRSHEGLSR